MFNLFMQTSDAGYHIAVNCHRLQKGFIVINAFIEY